MPILAVTGSYSRRDHVAALAAGCVDVIVKPFPPEHVGLIQSMLREPAVS
jgi:DNA-binding response OmpR family regulator